MDYNTFIRPVGNVFKYLSFRTSGRICQTTISGVAVDFLIPIFERYKFVSKPNEKTVIADFLANIRESDIVYDVGSHKGIYAAFAAKLGASIYAFEPIKSNQQVIKDVRDSNGFNNLKLVNCALGAENGEIELVAPTDDSTYRIGNSGVTVPQQRGDSFEYPSPTVLKIDVEGSEMSVLEGFNDRLSNVRIVYCEIHHNEGVSNDEMISFLSNFDLSPTILDKRAGRSILRFLSKENK